MGPDLDLIRAALPGYEVGGEIGRGGWGVVLQAEHRALGRRAAIKQLPPGLGADAVTRERFIEEARIVSSMDHPHIVPVYDFVEHAGVALIVMELLEGGTLWKRFTSPAGVRADAACAVILAVCSALDAAHRVGVLHRDLKPENVLFNLRGVPKLSDFGVAKVLGATKRRTMVGEILGTPAYMSPEHAQGRAVGPEADLYSLGVMLYELLAGRLPFDDEDPVALLVSHASAEPELVTQLADVPEPIGDVVMQALLKEPSERHASAEAFGVSLAMAAGRSWGAGWLHDSGIPLLAGGPIGDAAHRASSRPAPPTSRPTVRRSPSEGHHRRLGELDAAADDMSASTGTASPKRTLARVLLSVAAVVVVGMVAATLWAGGGADPPSLAYLTDADGRTLYVTDQDPPGTSNCNAPCSDTWPPVGTGLELAGIAKSRLAEISRADGTAQLALDGRALYLYAKDQKRGDAKGHGVSKVWFALGKNGQPIAVRVGSTDSGDVLVDAEGFTVYTFKKDTPGGVATCMGDCAKTWRGVPGDLLMDRSLDKAQFTVVARDDSGTQLAWKGRALYRFTGDEDPGDTNGTAEAGGDWEVVPAHQVDRSG